MYSYSVSWCLDLERFVYAHIVYLFLWINVWHPHYSNEELATVRNHTKRNIPSWCTYDWKTHHFRVVVMLDGCECLHDLIPNVGLTCVSLYSSAASHWWWFITVSELKFCSIELNDILLHVGLKIEYLCTVVYITVYRLSWPKLKLTSSQCGVWTTFT